MPAFLKLQPHTKLNRPRSRPFRILQRANRPKRTPIHPSLKRSEIRVIQNVRERALQPQLDLFREMEVLREPAIPHHSSRAIQNAHARISKSADRARPTEEIA